MVVPFISLGFRRMNDANLSKWLSLIPLVNLILAGFPSKAGIFRILGNLSFKIANGQKTTLP